MAGSKQGKVQDRQAERRIADVLGRAAGISSRSWGNGKVGGGREVGRPAPKGRGGEACGQRRKERRRTSGRAPRWEVATAPEDCFSRK